MFFYSLQTNFITLVYFVLLFVKMWAMVDAVLRPPQAYLAADKQTKTAWMWILGLTLGAHIFIPSFTLMLIGTVAAFVYIVDVKPALSAVTRRR